MNLQTLICLSLLIPWSIAQTITTTDSLGNAVIEVTSSDGPGLATTRTLETIHAMLPTLQQGPVPVPAPTTVAPHAPIPYVYTTTNALGQVVSSSDFYTPAFPSLPMSATPSTGTVLPYTQWMSIVGTNTVPPAHANVNAAFERWRSPMDNWWIGACLSLVCMSLSGVWLVWI